MQFHPSAPKGERERPWANTEDEQRREDATEAHERDEAAHLGVSLAELRQHEAARAGGKA
jgi:hypothetical protein